MTQRFTPIAITAAALLIAANSPSFAAAAPEGLPLWAWGVTTAPTTMGPGEVLPHGAPGSATAPIGNVDNKEKISIQGAKGPFTRYEIGNRFGPADWFPQDHPVMPEIVHHGRQSKDEAKTPPVWACSLCHMPNGKGRPENANITGLPYDYFVRQMLDFKEGRRKTSDNRKTNTALMIVFAQQMTREEIEEAARYLTAIPSTPWIKVIESDTAPKTNARGGVFHTITGEGAGTEPLGNRIVETPENAQQTEVLRNPRGMFIAYVPRGSVAKGKALATTGGGKTTACTVCHGDDLNGVGSVPALAARSPSYLARQINDFRQGARKGDMNEIMRAVAVKLNNDDILNLAAYTASLPAPSTGAPGTAAR